MATLDRSTDSQKNQPWHLVGGSLTINYRKHWPNKVFLLSYRFTTYVVSEQEKKDNDNYYVVNVQILAKHMFNSTGHAKSNGKAFVEAGTPAIAGRGKSILKMQILNLNMCI